MVEQFSLEKVNSLSNESEEGQDVQETEQEEADYFYLFRRGIGLAMLGLQEGKSELQRAAEVFKSTREVKDLEPWEVELNQEWEPKVSWYACNLDRLVRKPAGIALTDILRAEKRDAMFWAGSKIGGRLSELGRGIGDCLRWLDDVSKGQGRDLVDYQCWHMNNFLYDERDGLTWRRFYRGEEGEYGGLELPPTLWQEIDQLWQEVKGCKGLPPDAPERRLFVEHRLRVETQLVDAFIQQVVKPMVART